MTAPSVTQLPDPPSPFSTPSQFSADAFIFVAALSGWTGDINNLVAWLNANIDAREVVNETGTAFNLNAQNSGAYIRTTNGSAKTLTVQPESVTAQPEGASYFIANRGAGDLTIVAGDDVTINGNVALTENATAILQKIDTDTYDLITIGGDFVTDLTVLQAAVATLILQMTTRIQSVATIAELNFAGSYDGQQVQLVEYGGTAIPGVGGGILTWDATSTETADNGMVIEISGVAVGRWLRPKGEVDAGYYGLPLSSGFCYDQLAAIEAYCYANKVGCDFGPGIYDAGAQNWPFRNPTVPAPSLRDYTGVVIRTAGPSTVFKTTSDNGADVLQCNGIKGLRVEGYPTVTATLNTTLGAGSNGLSITYGGQDLYFELNCVDLPFVDKGTYGDGGKAFSIQPGSANVNPIKNIIIKGLARNCLYGAGIDVTYDSLATNPISGVVFDIVAEDCYRGFSGGVTAPTVAPASPAFMGVSGRIKAVNCQQSFAISRTPGLDLTVEVLNTKAKADLGGYLASFPTVLVADIKASKHSTVNIIGAVKDVDTVMSIGGTSMGGGISGDCASMRVMLDVSFTSATTQVEVISLGGNRVSSSDVSLYGVTTGFDDIMLYGGNSLKVNGKVRSPTAYPGDASVASPPVPFFAAIYAVSLTATRTVTLSTLASVGDRVNVARLAASTGSTLSVGGLRNIAAGQWVECTYNGSAWEITSSGTI